MSSGTPGVQCNARSTPHTVHTNAPNGVRGVLYHVEAIPGYCFQCRYAASRTCLSWPLSALPVTGATNNVATVGGQVFEGDLYEPLRPSLQGRVDLLVANVPYVPTSSIGLLPPEARLYEPRIALDGGPDGLDILRRVIAGAPTWLATGGHLLVESSEEQSAELADAIRRAGLQPRVENSAELGASVVIGTSTAATSGRTSPKDEP